MRQPVSALSVSTPPTRTLRSIAEVLHNIDVAMQYGEDADVKIREDREEGGEEEADGGDWNMAEN